MTPSKLKEQLMERWKTVDGYPRYEVSTHGRVKTNCDRAKTFLKLSPSGCRSGYVVVGLYKDGKVKTLSVHRLVLLAFSGPAPCEHQAGHLDGDKTNNHLSNLKWITAKENSSHKLIHGTRAIGSSIGQSKLTEAAVLEMRRDSKRIGSNKSNTKAFAEKFGVSVSAINHAIAGRTWRHL